MNFQNDRYTLRMADGSDNEGIRQIFQSGSFGGNLDIRFMRDPQPYESFAADGDSVKMMVIDDHAENRTIAVGGAVIRTEFLNGREQQCAYLTGLKIHPDYRHKIAFIGKAYQFLRGEIGKCDFTYTTILDNNTAAIKLLEKKHRNMPEYHYLGHYTTYCFHDGKRILLLEKDNLNGFDELVRCYFSKLSLVPIHHDYRGFGEKHFYSYRENGEIVACCFVGNQQATKQYKMCSYGGIYRLLYRLPTNALGYPRFPAPGTDIAYGAVSYLYVKDHDERLCRKFLRSVAAESGFSMLLWGGFENNPLCSALNKMKTVQYGSRLYAVVWDADSTADVNGVIGMEAALL